MSRAPGNEVDFRCDGGSIRARPKGPLPCLDLYRMRSYVLAIQGVMIVGLGVVFLYLRANMAEEVFDIVDVGWRFF